MNLPLGITVVCVHGIPTPGSDPRIQLGEVRNTLSHELGVERCTFVEVEWTDGSARAGAESLRRIGQGDLGSSGATLLQPSLNDALRSSQLVIVVGFSAGGLIVYNWIASLSSGTENMLFILIAAPHRSVEGFFFLEGRDK